MALNILCWRPRLSLLTALMAMTIVALSISVAGLWREVGPLRADNKRLNEERGTLVIGDPDKLHAIKVPTRFAGEGRDAYRIYVPEGNRYFAFVHINNIPKTGLPAANPLPGHAGILGSFQGRLFARLDPGEHVIVVHTSRRNDRADIVLSGGDDLNSLLDASANTSEKSWPTVTPNAYSVFEDGVRHATVAADGDKPLVLLRRRIEAASEQSSHASFVTPEPGYPLDGILVWLEPAP